MLEVKGNRLDIAPTGQSPAVVVPPVPAPRQISAARHQGKSTTLQNYQSYSSPSLPIESPEPPTPLTRTLLPISSRVSPRTGVGSPEEEPDYCTNLLKDFQSNSAPCLVFTSSPSASEEGRPEPPSKRPSYPTMQCMQSRYMTDLEWRICHAVNIYVYRNGCENQTPILVSIPPARKKNMRNVMAVIQDRMKWPIGYAKRLYKMDGTRIRHPCELEMYNNYVVGSNYDKHFKCVQYGRKRSPLLVLARESKHVRVLRMQNCQFNEWLMKKKAAGDERPQYVYPSMYSSTRDGFGPGDLPCTSYQPMCKAPTANQNQSYDYNDDQVQGNQGQGQGQGPKYNQDYIVNTMTIDSGPSRDPAQLLKNRKDNLERDLEKGPKSARYKPIGKDGDSVFYSSKPKKKSKGVIDVSGDKKIFGSDYNANLLKNEYDEIPDLSEPAPKYNIETELCDVQDEDEYVHVPPQRKIFSTLHQDGSRRPPVPPAPRLLRRTGQNEVNQQSSQACDSVPRENEGQGLPLSETSRPFTLVAKCSPTIAQGTTQTRSVLRKPPLAPNSNTKLQQGPRKPWHVTFTPEPATSGTSVLSGGRDLNSNPSASLLSTAGKDDDHVLQTLWKPSKASTDLGSSQGQQEGSTQGQARQLFGLNLVNGGVAQAPAQGSPFRQVIIDGAPHVTPRASRPFLVAVDHDPNSGCQQNFGCQTSGPSNTMLGTDEVDIPFTPPPKTPGSGRKNPVVAQSQQPQFPYCFYPQFQELRVLPAYAGSFNVNCEAGPTSKTTIDKPKVRNVATQFGPSIDESESMVGEAVPFKSSVQGPSPGQQQMFQDQQLRVQAAILQQQQFAAQLNAANSGPLIYQSPTLYLAEAGQGGVLPTAQGGPFFQGLMQRNWNSGLHMQSVPLQFPTNLSFVPPPTGFQDARNLAGNKLMTTTQPAPRPSKLSVNSQKWKK